MQNRVLLSGNIEYSRALGEQQFAGDVPDRKKEERKKIQAEETLTKFKKWRIEGREKKRETILRYRLLNPDGY